MTLLLAVLLAGTPATCWSQADWNRNPRLCECYERVAVQKLSDGERKRAEQKCRDRYTVKKRGGKR